MGSLRSLVHNPRSKGNQPPDAKTWMNRLSEVLIRDVPKVHPDVFIDVQKRGRPKHLLVTWKWYDDVSKAEEVRRVIWKTIYTFRLKSDLDLHTTFTRPNVCDVINLSERR
jgi:hypothetical protein